MAKLLKADGTREEVRPKGQHFTLEELQACVGGYVELLKTPDGKDLYCNEDGKELGLPMNEEATRIMRPYLRQNDPGVVGDVLIADRKEVQ